jgi:predicted Zn-dependent protease
MLIIEGEGILSQVKLAECTILPGLTAGAERTLYTPDGGRLDSMDVNAFIKIEQELATVNGFRMVNLLESSWKLILSTLVVLLVAFFILAIWGVPCLSSVVAFSLPDNAVEKLGDEMLSQADHLIFEQSELDLASREHIHKLVNGFADEIGVTQPRKLVFRKSPIGPNAFAFPGNIMVLTDELVSFVEEDAEILGVVAHELAHLKGRHALQSALQNSGISLIVTLWIGDANSMASVMGRFTTLVLNSSYSREFEQEADMQASKWLLAVGYGVQPMISFMERLKTSDTDLQLPEFFSSHPTLENRILFLRSIAERNLN